MEGLQDQAAPLVPNYRALKAVVIILGVLILLGLAALVAGMVMGLGPKTPAAQTVQPYTVQLAAPAGAHVADAEIDGNRLLVRIDDAAGGTVVVLDPATGRVVGRIVLHAQP